MRPGDRLAWRYRTKLYEQKGRSGYYSGFRFGRKDRLRPAPKGSGIPVGSRIRWRWNSIQDVKKVSKDRYLIFTRFKKKFVRFRRR